MSDEKLAIAPGVPGHVFKSEDSQLEHAEEPGTTGRLQQPARVYTKAEEDKLYRKIDIKVGSGAFRRSQWRNAKPELNPFAPAATCRFFPSLRYSTCCRS